MREAGGILLQASGAKCSTRASGRAFVENVFRDGPWELEQEDRGEDVLVEGDLGEDSTQRMLLPGAYLITMDLQPPGRPSHTGVEDAVRTATTRPKGRGRDFFDVALPEGPDVYPLS